MIQIRDGQTGEVILTAEAEDLPGKVLGAVRLQNDDFASLDLSRVVLSHANLRGVTFRQGRLASALVNNAYLVDVCFDEATLDQIDLSETTIAHCCFRGASLRNANLRYAKLASTDLTNADLSGANLSMSVLQGDLTGANLSNADLQGADLRAAIIDRADFTGAKLSNAKVVGEKLTTFHSRLARQAAGASGAAKPAASKKPSRPWWQVWR